MENHPEISKQLRKIAIEKDHRMKQSEIDVGREPSADYEFLDGALHAEGQDREANAERDLEAEGAVYARRTAAKYTSSPLNAHPRDA